MQIIQHDLGGELKLNITTMESGREYFAFLGPSTIVMLSVEQTRALREFLKGDQNDKT